MNKDVIGVRIELSSGVTLSGRVEPPGAAKLSIRPDAEIGLANVMELAKTAMVTAEADKTGAFTLHDAPAGKLVLVAHADEGATGELHIVIGDTDQSGLVVPLEARGSSAGTVTDTNGAPVEGATVYARNTKHEMSIDFSGSRESSTTAADGSFKIVGLDEGSYMVFASVGFAFRSSGSKKSSAAVELGKAEAHTGVQLVVEARDGVIHGTVLGADGKPAPDAWVTAHSSQIRATASEGDDSDEAETLFGGTDPVLTAADGTFVIGKLAKGTYTVVADGPRGATRAEQKSVKPGDNVTLTLGSLGTLAGTVTISGAPAALYDLTCSGASGTIERRINAADGSYDLEHLTPGTYACSASADSGTAHASIAVPSGDAHLDLALLAWPSLAGAVVSVLDGKAVPGVVVIVGGFSGRAMGAAITGGAPTTDAAGHFEVDRVEAGSGNAMFLPATGGLQPLATKPYIAINGQRTDLGAIKVVPPRTGEAGTLGLSTEPAASGSALAVTLVTASGPAAAAGVQVGDTIVAIGGVAVGDLGVTIAQQLLASGTMTAGDVIPLGLGRGVTVSVTAAKW